MHYETFEIFCNYELLIYNFLKILSKNTLWYEKSLSLIVFLDETD